LQEKMKRIEMEAETSKERVLYLEGETRRMGEQIWLANERVANQDRELGDLHGQVSWLRSENERLGREMEEEKRKFMEAGGVDYSKYEEMRQAEATLREEKSKVEWHLGEVTQWWNDAKWRQFRIRKLSYCRIGELEAGMAHRQWLLDQANQKVFELSSEHEYLRQFRDKAKNTLDGTFLIRRQPIDGRYKWRLAMWDENSPDDLKDYRRVWFETTAPNAKRVFLSASFVNWECALLCDNFDKENSKFGVWVDIPPGRYEFLFIVDGEWKTCDGYPTVTNEFGSQNNWRYID
uniref:AMPK1_CBM domain-containing protein n=1 Tax=Toxocara canis TaxID=6265 RepID=A0A183V2N7_TOXCA